MGDTKPTPMCMMTDFARSCAGYSCLLAECNKLERELAESRTAQERLLRALREQRTQMDFPLLPPVFAATMRQMIDAAILEASKKESP